MSAAPIAVPVPPMAAALALWRAWARMAVGSVDQVLGLGALVICAPLVGSMLREDVFGTRFLLDALLLGVPLLAGRIVQGRALGPGGHVVLDRALPALPVSDTARVLAATLFADALLAAGTAGVGTLLWALLAEAPPTNPFSGAGIAPQQLGIVVSAQVLGYAPLLALGARSSSATRACDVGLACLLLVGLGWAGVGRALAPSAVFAIVGMPLALALPARGAAHRAIGRFRPLGAGLYGVLGGITLVTGAIAVVGSALMAAITNDLDIPDDLFALFVAYVTSLLPLLPASMAGGSVLPSSVGPLLRLPVSRERLYGTLLALGIGRGVVFGFVATVMTLPFGAPPPAGTVIATLLLGAAAGALTPSLILRAGKRTGLKLLALALVVLPFGLALHVAAGRAPLVWMVGATVAAVAIGLLITRAAIRGR